jgi:hypothetical protein
LTAERSTPWVLEQLQDVAGARKPQVDELQTSARRADERLDKLLARQALEDELHAQLIAIERQRAVEVGHGDARVRNILQHVQPQPVTRDVAQAAMWSKTSAQH